MRRIFFLISIFYFGLTFINAQEIKNSFSQEREIELGELIITPYKTKLPFASSSVSVEKINAEKEVNYGKLDLNAVLKERLSVNLASSGISQTSIFLRGANSYHTQFLLDGIKLYDPIITNAYYYGFGSFSLINIGSIEIAKGSFSSLYGSDAIGGVINLFTKKGKEKAENFYIQKIGFYDNYGLSFFEEAFSSSGKFKDIFYSLGVCRKDSKGYSSAKEKNNNPERDPFSNLNFSLRLDYLEFEGIELSLITHYIYTKYEYDRYDWVKNLPVDDQDNLAYYHEGAGGLLFKQNLNDNFFYKILFGFTRIYRKGKETQTQDYWYDGKTYQLKFQSEFSPTKEYKLILGFDYLREKADSYSNWGGFISDFPKETLNTKGIFIENICNISDNLFFNFSFRTQKHPNFGTHSVKNVGFSYTFKKTNTQFKFSYSEGFKSPSLYQLYEPSYGNQNLNPERSEGYQLNVIQDFKRCKFEVSYFHTEIKDMIDWVNTGLWTGKYENIGKSEIDGTEFGLEIKALTNLKIYFGYNYLSPKNKTNSKILPRRAKNRFLFKIESVFDKLNTEFLISYTGNRFSDNENKIKLKPHFLANLSLIYKLNKNLNFFLRFENLFNEKYEDIYGYQSPKFSTYMGLKYKF